MSNIYIILLTLYLVPLLLGTLLVFIAYKVKQIHPSYHNGNLIMIAVPLFNILMLIALLTFTYSYLKKHITKKSNITNV